MGTGLLQPADFLIMLVVVVLVLGPGWLGSLGRALGQSWREFVAGLRTGAGETTPPAALPARPCPRCAAWSTDTARYCTRCGAALG